MGKERHLQRRGGSQGGVPGRLYFRLTIPKDVQRYFDGKRELKRSLKTARYNNAIQVARVETYRAERLFARLRGGFMTQNEMRKMVAAYFEDTLALAEDARADGSGVPEDNEDRAKFARWLGFLPHPARTRRAEGAADVADSIIDCADHMTRAPMNIGVVSKR
jgi:hypothetical protein